MRINDPTGTTVVSKFAPAGSYIASASITADPGSSGRGATESVDCFLRVPGQAVSFAREAMILLQNSVNTAANLALTGGFTLANDAFVDVWCTSSTSINDFWGYLTLTRVGSLT